MKYIEISFISIVHSILDFPEFIYADLENRNPSMILLMLQSLQNRRGLEIS